MSDTSQGPGWWLASDGQWYPPESRVPQPLRPTDPTAGRRRSGASSGAGSGGGQAIDLLQDPWKGSGTPHRNRKHRPLRWIASFVFIALVLLVAVALIKGPLPAGDSAQSFCNLVTGYANAGHQFNEPNVAGDLISHAPLEVKPYMITTINVMGLDPEGLSNYYISHSNEFGNPRRLQDWLSANCPALGN